MRALIAAALGLLFLGGPACAAEEKPTEPDHSLASREGEMKTVERAKTAPAKAVAQKKAGAEDEDFKRELKTVRGRVVSVLQGRLAVEFDSSEETGAEEMLISLGKDTQLLNFKSASDLKYGDGVKVDYELVYRVKKDDKAMEPLLVGTTAKRVTLIQKAKSDPRLAGGAADEE